MSDSQRSDELNTEQDTSITIEKKVSDETIDKLNLNLSEGINISPQQSPLSKSSKGSDESDTVQEEFEKKVSDETLDKLNLNLPEDNESPLQSPISKSSKGSDESDTVQEVFEKKVSDETLDKLNLNLPEDNESPQQSPISKSLTNGDLKNDENIVFSFSPSQDKLTCTGKKNPKTYRRGETYDNFPLLTKLVVKSFISQNSMKDPQGNRKLYQVYPNPDELCDDCRWLVKATKSADSMKSSSEDEEFVSKWIESRKSVKICRETSVSGKNSTELVSKDYNKDNVSELLSEVHSRLLECNILLTTQKLQKKLRKSGKEDEEQESPVRASDTSLHDDWFDQIQTEEDSKDGASKLCLVLERLVSKYLKCSEK